MLSCGKKGHLKRKRPDKSKGDEAKDDKKDDKSDKPRSDKGKEVAEKPKASSGTLYTGIYPLFIVQLASPNPIDTK